MPWEGRGRAVEAFRDEKRIAIMDGDCLVDFTVHRVTGEETGTVFTVDPEVIDLLELDLDLGHLIVFVRRV